MLTLQQLKDMEPHTIFASGLASIPHPWEGDKTIGIKWVAIRGGIHDWAIYHSYHSNIVEFRGFGEMHIMAPDSLVADCGTKIHNRDTVQSLVPCDEEALAMYRD